MNRNTMFLKNYYLQSYIMYVLKFDFIPNSYIIIYLQSRKLPPIVFANGAFGSFLYPPIVNIRITFGMLAIRRVVPEVSPPHAPHFPDLTPSDYFPF